MDSSRAAEIIGCLIPHHTPYKQNNQTLLWTNLGKLVAYNPLRATCRKWKSGELVVRPTRRKNEKEFRRIHLHIDFVN